jgi:hypothetical protein
MNKDMFEKFIVYIDSRESFKDFLNAVERFLLNNMDIKIENNGNYIQYNNKKYFYEKNDSEFEADFTEFLKDVLKIKDVSFLELDRFYNNEECETAYIFAISKIYDDKIFLSGFTLWD